MYDKSRALKGHFRLRKSYLGDTKNLTVNMARGEREGNWGVRERRRKLNTGHMMEVEILLRRRRKVSYFLKKTFLYLE